MSKSRRTDRNWTLGRTLHGYVAWELVHPTVLTFGGLTVLLLTAELFGFSDLIINRGFGFGVILQLMLFKVIVLASRTLPFATLVGTLVGLGRLKTDLEILAMQASGVSRRQFVAPVLTFSAGMTGLGLVLTLFGAPWASVSLADLEQSMAQNNPTLLRAGETHTFGSIRILAREVSSRGDQLSGVVVWTPEQSAQSGQGETFLAGQTIFAERGEVRSGDEGKAQPIQSIPPVQLILHNGLTLSPIRGTGGSTRFQTLWISLNQNSAENKPSVGYGETKGRLERVPLSRLLQIGWPPDTQPAYPQPEPPEVKQVRYIKLVQSEFHRRFSAPIACLVLGLLAAPITLLSRTFSRAGGCVSGLIVTVVYYGLVQLGDGLVQATAVSPAFGVWLPNILVGTLAVLLLAANNHWDWLRWRGQHSRQLATDASAFLNKHSLKRYVLARYVARSYLSMLLLSFGFLFTGYFLVDMLERLQWFARYQADLSEIVRFYGARSPLLASRMIPMSLVLATALTVGLLSLHRELIGMRACGISVVRALSPILLIAGLIAPCYLFLNETIVPRTNAYADWLKITEIKSQADDIHMQPLAIWHQNGKLYHTRQLDTVNKEAQDISIFELDTDGLPTSRTDARTARHIGDGVWELADPIRLTIHDTSFELVPTSPHIQLGTEPKVQVDTMHLNARQLSQAIRTTEASGYNATAYRVAFHMKLAAPLVCLLLPAATLFFALGGPPFPGPALTILVSIGLGIGSILLSDVFSSLGYGGFVPSSLAGWGPCATLVLLAGVFAVRSQGEIRPSLRLPKLFQLSLLSLPLRPTQISNRTPVESTSPVGDKRKRKKRKKKRERSMHLSS